MMKGRKFNFILLMLVIIQIVLLVGYLFSDNYIISKNNQKTIVLEGNKKIGTKKLFNLLVGFFSIKQIGIVSATDSSACCFETNSGAICQDLASVDSPTCSPGNSYPTECSETDECRQGCCISPDYGNCAPRSPKSSCESSGGIWKDDPKCLVKECELGCCVLGGQKRMITKSMCDKFGEMLGFSGIWTPNVPELECLMTPLPDKEGACIDGFGDCSRKLRSECEGKFYEGFLCTSQELNTRCNPTAETTCVEEEDEVFFVDSCGNKANVYDASKVYEDSYWEKITEPDCGDDLGNLNSRDCGKCKYQLGSKCGKAKSGEDANPRYGENICKDLSCVDENGKVRLNGESWCVYDGFVGEGKDPVGSRHWKRYCIDGEIRVEACDDYRGEVCTDKDIERNGDGRKYSLAYCVLNEASNCLSYNDKEDPDDKVRLCNRNTHCEVQTIEFGDSFKIEMCTPKYPKGFDISSGSENSAICSMANRKCDVYYQTGFYSGYECVSNCECLEESFVNEMNELCVSLGDCGSYINYEGRGTDSAEVLGDSEYTTDWKKYISFATPVMGQKVAEKNLEDVLSSFIGDVSNYTAEQMDKAAYDLSSQIIGATGGAVGLVGGLLGGNLLGIPLGYASALSAGLGVGLSAFSGAIAGLALGMMIGYAISVSLGLGKEATIGMVVSAAALGAVIGGVVAAIIDTAPVLIAVQMGVAAAISGSIPIAGWIASAVIAVAAAITMAVMGASGQGRIKVESVEFQCLPWSPPIAGNDCSKCNDDPLKPCTKYRCESLGAACKLVGENTDNPKCEWINRGDSNPPEISALAGNLTEGYKFFDESSNGVELRTENGDCVRRYEQVLFQLQTDKLAQCKFDYFRPTERVSFDDFGSYGLDQNSFVQNHTFAFFMMDLEQLRSFNETLDTTTLYDEIDMYVKCRDANGNENEREYLVDICVDKGPDLTPVDYSRVVMLPKSGSYIAHGKTDIELDMFVPEPAECRFSSERATPYEMMGGMNCSYNFGSGTSIGWPCKANLTEITTGTNYFYFKCKDKPWAEEDSRNTNQEDLEYSVSVSENNLEIESTSPKGYILRYQEPTSIDLEVKTIGGAPDANSICNFLWGGSWMPFKQVDENTYVQKDLSLFAGTFNIPFKCIDDAGNKANGTISFQLEVDDEAPIITRAYEDGSSLKFNTNENARCYYDLNSCNFDLTEDKKVSSQYSKTHFLEWNSLKTYHIKCMDEFGNKNFDCAMIIQPQANPGWIQ